MLIRPLRHIWKICRVASDNIDKINRMAKEYAHRVQLAEGRATENYNVNGKDGLPFQVIITKTYEVLPEQDEQDDIDEVMGEES